jgi:hypothetical protein
MYFKYYFFSLKKFPPFIEFKIYIVLLTYIYLLNSIFFKIIQNFNYYKIL